MSKTNWVKVSTTDDLTLTPEIKEWLKEVNEKINKQIDDSLADWLLFGKFPEPQKFQKEFLEKLGKRTKSIP